MAYITLGAFEMSVFGYYDAFYINNPILSGTPLNVWLLAIIFAVLYVLFFVIYELVKRKIYKNKVILSNASEGQDKETDSPQINNEK